MEYTEQQKDEIRQQFRLKRRRQIILAVLVVTCMLLVISFSGNEPATLFGLPPEVLMGLFLVLIIGALGYSLYNWRCPACNRYLGKAISPSYCSRCGVALR